MPRKHLTIPVEDLACSNAVTIQAVVHLLSERGILDWKDVHDFVEKLKRNPAPKGLLEPRK